MMKYRLTFNGLAGFDMKGYALKQEAIADAIEKREQMAHATNVEKLKSQESK